jgi:hypothetical protein
LLGWVAGDAIVADSVVQNYLTARLNAAEMRDIALAAAPICAVLVLGVAGSLRRVYRPRSPKERLG